jgi:hypothetical protein
MSGHFVRMSADTYPDGGRTPSVYRGCPLSGTASRGRACERRGEGGRDLWRPKAMTRVALLNTPSRVFGGLT